MSSGPAIWWRWWCASRLRDVVHTAVVTLVLVSGTLGEAHPGNPMDRVQFPHHAAPAPPLSALLLVVVACLALGWRRRWPVAVLAVSTAAVAGYSLLGYVNGAALLAPAIALFAVAARESLRRTAVLGVLTMAVLMASTAARNPFGHITGGGFDIIPALISVAAAGGIAVASRRAFVDSIQARADDEARRRIDEERLRIARELHDVVAHTMATINVQAGAAAHVAAERPDAAVEALQAIKVASREGLRELRAILNVLRQADEPDSTQPAPGLAQLDDLISGTRRAGLATTLTVTGDARPLPAAADLAAYRIVQESLTNAIRHAGPATASVSLRYGRAELTITVADDGRGPGADQAAGGGGHGLAGMRERAASVGGTVAAGPGPAGGFVVTARLPLPPGEAAGSRPAPAPAAAEAAAPAAEGSRS